MSLRKPSIRKPLSMTSLIDVIFLLLLFFMLSSTFSKFAEIDVPVSGGAVAPGSDIQQGFLKVENDRLLLNGVVTRPDELRQAVIEKSQGTTLSLIVSLGATSTAQTLTDLLATLRGLETVRLTLIGAKT